MKKEFLPSVKKKGSHIGFVVSFVIFITFLLFLFVIIQPSITRDKSKNFVLDSLELNLLENVSSEVTTVTINVEESSGSKDCINLQSIDDNEIPEEVQDKLIIKNSDGEILNYEEQGQGIEIETGTNFMGVLKVYYSDDLTGLTNALNGCDPKAYSVGIIKTYSETTESKFLELNSTYYSDYDGLKADFGIPEGTEFSFILFDIEREGIIFESEIEEPPETINVYASETPVQYLDDEGKLNYGFLVIKVW